MTKASCAFVLGALTVAGCANNSGSTFVACEPVTSGPAAALSHWSGTVITIVMENKSRSEIFGNPKAPYMTLSTESDATAMVGRRR